MALHDILSAITAEADKQIAALKAQHERTVADAESKADSEFRRLTIELEAHLSQKSDQLTRKARQLAEQIRRNAVLQHKRKILDSIYASALDRLSNESDAVLEPLFSALLSQFSSGEIRPAKKHVALIKKIASGKEFIIGDPIDAKGGFLCLSKTREEDCRLESIVFDSLRPRTELAISKYLFPTINS